MARITSQYGDVYFLAIDSSVCRSSLERFTLNGLFLGIRDTIPLMQPIRLRHRFALLKYVIVFTNSGTKLPGEGLFYSDRIRIYGYPVTYLVDANVLSEPTKPNPDLRVVEATPPISGRRVFRCSTRSTDCRPSFACRRIALNAFEPIVAGLGVDAVFSGSCDGCRGLQPSKPL